jgi:hypothetical protein
MEHNPGKPDGIESDIAAISRRLEGAKRLRQQLFPEQLEPVKGVMTEEEMIDRLQQRLRGTPEARAEDFIAPEQIPLLSQKINQVRQTVMSEGKPFTENVDYEEWIRNGLRDKEDADNLFWDDLEDPSSDERFQIFAERFKPESDPSGTGYRLAMVRFRSAEIIEIDLGFANNFQLQIHFKDQDEMGNSVPSYNSSDLIANLTLDQMTMEEFRIISNSLDKYLHLFNQGAHEETQQ